MECYFLRHGPAVDPARWPGDDYDRPLTPQGRQRIAREAGAIAALSLELEAIVTSPLVRAQQTASIVAGKLKIPERLVEDARLGSGFDREALEEMLAERPNAGAILLVGHEPTMSATIGAVVGGAQLVFKKGGLACVTFASTGSPLTGELLWLIPPKVLLLSR